MSKWTSSGQGTNTDTISILYIAQKATPDSRVFLYDVMTGSDATPVDAAADYVLIRITAEHATPGGTAAGIEALDTGDSVSTIDAAIMASTGQPTHAAVPADTMLRFGLNQRATFRWVAAPGGEIVIPATANNGITFESTGAPSATWNATACFHWSE